MTEDSKSTIRLLLSEKREEFLERWQLVVKENLARGPASIQDCVFEESEFAQIFDAYLDDIAEDPLSVSQQFVVNLVKHKIFAGFPLSTLEILNAAFMATAREVFRSAFPEAFNTRMEALEHLAQEVLNNEIALARFYEEYLNDLNTELREKAAALKRRNEALLEFLDLATHELQSPLWSILGFAAKLLRQYHSVMDETGRHCVDRINANVSEMHQLIEDVAGILMIDQENMVMRPVSLRGTLRYALRRVRNEVDEKFECQMDEGTAIEIDCDPRHFKQCFYQLLKNAALFAQHDEPGQASIRVLCNDRLHLYIEDNGIGIEERYRAQVFKPMERLKEKDVAGTGMGLAVAQRIVAAHRGSILLEDSSLGGVCVHMALPLDIVSHTQEKE
ncbi:ATP-binding protein [Candidatus Sumerlaeota bacterium]